MWQRTEVKYIEWQRFYMLCSRCHVCCVAGPNIVWKRSNLCVRVHSSFVSEVEFAVSQRSSLLCGRGQVCLRQRSQVCCEKMRSSVLWDNEVKSAVRQWGQVCCETRRSSLLWDKEVKSAVRQWGQVCCETLRSSLLWDIEVKSAVRHWGQVICVAKVTSNLTDTWRLEMQAFRRW